MPKSWARCHWTSFPLEMEGVNKLIADQNRMTLSLRSSPQKLGREEEKIGGNSPFPAVDAIVLLNVLEHIEDHMAAVSQLYRILKPGGIAVIAVPARAKLYDVYDKLLLHCRRHSARALAWLLKQNGLRIIEQSHLGFFIYPGFWFVKHRNRNCVFENEQARGQIVAEEIRTTKNSRLLDTVLRAELFLGRWVSYPFGIRCLITCMKPARIPTAR
jgi:SAM-dependent methyltransferase